MSYIAAVENDAPTFFYRMDVSAGAREVDSVGSVAAPPATVVGSNAFGVPGLLAGDSLTAASWSAGGYLWLPDQAGLNVRAGGYTRKTVSAVFRATDVVTSAVIYEQGGTANGLNLYVRAGRLYAGAWSFSTGWPANLFVSTPIVAGVIYHAACVLDANADTFALYLNGQLVGTAAGTGGAVLSTHSGDCAIAGMQNDTLLDTGPLIGDGLRFAGVVGPVAHWDEVALSDAQVAAHAAAVFDPGQRITDAFGRRPQIGAIL